MRLSDKAIRAYVSQYAIRRPVDWPALFCHDRPLFVEIGSGLGEFLIRRAAADPGTHFIGIEQDWTRVKRILRRIDETPEPLANVRVLQIDAVTALERLFVPRSIRTVQCLFPCPWPKRAHTKHRLFGREVLRLVNSRLDDGGELRIVTDFTPYADWVESQSEGTGFFCRRARVGPGFETKFERKWRREGIHEFEDLRFEKRRHIPVPVAEDVPLKLHFAEKFDPDRFHFPDRHGRPAVIAKEFLFDPRRRKAMVRLIVAEGTITQHLWVQVTHGRRGWCVAKAEGHTVLPTEGVDLALRLVGEAVVKSAA